MKKTQYEDKDRTYVELKCHKIGIQIWEPPLLPSAIGLTNPTVDIQRVFLAIFLIVNFIVHYQMC